MTSEPSQVKMLCTKHGDVPFLIVEAAEYKKTYCLVCFHEAMVRMGVHSVYPALVKPAPVEWPESLEVE